MQLSDERIQEMKDLLEKEHKKEVTWQEASDAAYNLAGLADLMFDCWVEDKRREKKLKESPKGFVLESSGYTCAICHNGTPVGENWYDKWGIKCSTCQKAIDRKEIPASLAKSKDSWYSKYEIESTFNIKGPALRSFVKKGILQSRIVKSEHNRPHTELFLIKDNKDTLPPKKLVKSRMISEEKDGKTWHRSEPWYKFVNPHEHLKGYKIMDHLRVVELDKE